MKSLFRKALTVLGPAIMGLLGFTGCGEGGIIGGGEIWCEYGTPNCDYKVDITVVDESGKSLKDIMVIHAPMKNFSGRSKKDFMMTQGKDTLTTDGKGKATHTYNIFSPPDKSKIYLEDSKGIYAKDSIELTPVQTAEGKSWYSGEWTVSGKKKMKKN